MKLTLDIPDKALKGLLCDAFEGGSNYWYTNLAPMFPRGLSMRDFQEGGKAQDPQEYWYWAELLPLTKGGAVTLQIQDEGGQTLAGRPHRIDRAKILKGLKIFQRDYPKHFADFLSENDDATTGDVFLQCCVFGEVIYG
jgi:hypothetical protein